MEFQKFLQQFLTCWRDSSIENMKQMISPNYQGREIRNGSIEDFGYEQSIEGWTQGFHFVLENNAEWDIRVIHSFPLRTNEYMAIIVAGLKKDGIPIGSYSVFVDTFQKEDVKWQRSRSTIETGIPENMLKEISILGIEGKSG